MTESFYQAIQPILSKTVQSNAIETVAGILDAESVGTLALHLDGIFDSAKSMFQQLNAALEGLDADDLDQLLVDIEIDQVHLRSHWIRLVEYLRKQDAWMDDDIQLPLLTENPPAH